MVIYSKETTFQGIYLNEKRYRNPESAICMERKLSANDIYGKRKRHSGNLFPTMPLYLRMKSDFNGLLSFKAFCLPKFKA